MPIINVVLARLKFLTGTSRLRNLTISRIIESYLIDK